MDGIITGEVETDEIADLGDLGETARTSLRAASARRSHSRDRLRTDPRPRPRPRLPKSRPRRPLDKLKLEVMLGLFFLCLNPFGVCRRGGKAGLWSWNLLDSFYNRESVSETSNCSEEIVHGCLPSTISSFEEAGAQRESEFVRGLPELQLRMLANCLQQSHGAIF